jgi:hypothetical protein
MADPDQSTWVDGFTETCLELEVADLLVGSLRRDGMNVDSTIAATVSADLVSLVTSRTNDSVSRRLRSAFGSGLKKQSDERARAEQWLEHFEPQLRVLGHSRSLPFDFVSELARRRLCGEYVYGPEAAIQELDDLLAASRLWGDWPEPATGPSHVRAWVEIGEDEVAQASREWRDADAPLPSHELMPVTPVPIVGGFHCGVQVELRPGQVIVVGIVKARELRQYDEAVRAWAEHHPQSDDAGQFPSPPSSYRVAYVMTEARALTCVEGDERTYTVVDEYLYGGSASHAELTARVAQALPGEASRYPHGAEIVR